MGWHVNDWVDLILEKMSVISIDDRLHLFNQFYSFYSVHLWFLFHDPIQSFLEINISYNCFIQRNTIEQMVLTFKI